MPRPNKERTIGAERILAARVERERQARGWSYQRVADAMTEAGCSTTGSALFKIQNIEHPRRITVDEFVALSRVWAIPLERLVEE